MSNPLTKYHSFSLDAGQPGLLVDGNDLAAIVDSYVNDQSTPIDFGVAVAFSASTKVNGIPTTTCKAPTSNSSPIIGISERQFKQSMLVDGTVFYNQYEPVPVIRQGKVWVEAAENVLANDKVVCIMKGISAVSAVKSGGNTGNGTLVVDATTPVADNATSGIYAVRITTAGTNSFTATVTDPNAVLVGTISVSGSGASGTFNNQIKFAITDGGTDFIVGDGFDITVTTGNGVLGGSSNNSTNGTATVTHTVGSSTGTIVPDVTTPVLANATTGNYTVTCITAPSANVYTLRVADPLGRVLGDILNTTSLQASTFSDQIKFVYTDNTDPSVGDYWTIAVATNVNRIQMDGTLGNCHAVWDDTTANGSLGRVRIVRSA